MKNLYALFVCVLVVLQVSAQRSQKRSGSFNQPNRQVNNFLQKQWWLGFKAGPNLSKPIMESPYYIVSPTNYDIQEISKEYESFRLPGSQVTFELTFYFRRFTLSFQPSYRTNRFTYTNKYEWIDAENPDKRLQLDYAQEQKIGYLDWPLLAKYEFQAGHLIPYALFGVYSSLRVDATKSVTVSGVDYASGGVHNFENEPVIIGASDLFAKYHWGLEAGAGIYYPLGNVRINMELSYKIGMSNIASTRNRYASDRLSGVGDSLDDLKLNSLSLSVGCLFPLRFLGSGFKSMIEK